MRHPIYIWIHWYSGYIAFFPLHLYWLDAARYGFACYHSASQMVELGDCGSLFWVTNKHLIDVNCLFHTCFTFHSKSGWFYPWKFSSRNDLLRVKTPFLGRCPLKTIPKWFVHGLFMGNHRISDTWDISHGKSMVCAPHEPPGFSPPMVTLQEMGRQRLCRPCPWPRWIYGLFVDWIYGLFVDWMVVEWIMYHDILWYIMIYYDILWLLYVTFCTCW